MASQGEEQLFAFSVKLGAWSCGCSHNCGSAASTADELTITHADPAPAASGIQHSSSGSSDTSTAASSPGLGPCTGARPSWLPKPMEAEIEAPSDTPYTVPHFYSALSMRQSEAAPDLEALFVAAQAAAKALSPSLGNEALLGLYARYKCATVGPASGRRPGMFDPVGRAKWDAWEALAAMSQDEAKHTYCALVDGLSPGWRSAAFPDVRAGQPVISAPRPTVISSPDRSPSFGPEEEPPSEETQETQAADADLKARPCFNGRWRLSRIEGDFEALLNYLGKNWAFRKMAKGMNYGVGKLTETIDIHADSFTIVRGGSSSSTTSLLIGGDEVETIFDGDRVVMNVKWDREALVTTTRKLDGVGALPPTKRYLGENGEMAVDITTSKGLVCRRLFKRDD